jgi:ATP-dependent RNA helicase DeaD
MVVEVVRPEPPRGDVPAVVEADGDRPGRGRIFFTLGEQDGADAGKVREAVQALAPGVELQDIELRRTHSFLILPPEVVDGAVAALDGKEWNGKRLGAERARRRRR